MNSRIVGFAALALMLAGVASQAETTVEQAGRATLAATQDSIIGVTAVVRIEAGGERQDVPIDTFGTVIHESGLIIVSDRMLNPTRGIQAPMGITLRSSVSKIMLRYADGTEMPASSIYSDPDLDLAFLLPRPRPDQHIPALKPVAMDKTAQIDIMDETFSLGRLPKALNWEPRVVLARVTSIAKKPRKAYYLSDFSGPGLPAFTTSGACLGIISQKSIPSGEFGKGQATPVVVPCADIVDLMPTVIAAAEKARAEPFEQEEESEATAAPAAGEKPAAAPAKPEAAKPAPAPAATAEPAKK